MDSSGIGSVYLNLDFNADFIRSTLISCKLHPFLVSNKALYEIIQNNFALSEWVSHRKKELDNESQDSKCKCMSIYVKELASKLLNGIGLSNVQFTEISTNRNESSDDDSSDDSSVDKGPLTDESSTDEKVSNDEPSSTDERNAVDDSDKDVFSEKCDVCKRKDQRSKSNRVIGSSNLRKYLIYIIESHPNLFINVFQYLYIDHLKKMTAVVDNEYLKVDIVKDIKIFVSVAAEENNLDIFKYLVRNMRAHISDDVLCDALVLSCENGFFDIVKYILGKPSNENDASFARHDAVLSCPSKSPPSTRPRQATNSLISYSDTCSSVKYNAVSESLRNCRNIIVMYLVNTGFVTLDIIKLKDNFILKGCSMCNYQQTIKYLFSIGITIEDVVSSKAYMSALEYNNIDLFKYYVSKGLTLADIRKDNNVILKNAISKGKLKFVKYLISLGLTVQDVRACIEDNIGRYPSNNLHIIRYLQSIGLTTEDFGYNNLSALRYAIHAGNFTYIKFLMTETGITVNDVKNQINSIFNSFCDTNVVKNYVKILQYFVSLGISVDDIRKSHNIMDNAITSGNIKFVKYLLSIGINLSDDPKEAMPVLGVAVANKLVKTIKLFSNMLLRLNEQNLLFNKKDTNSEDRKPIHIFIKLNNDMEYEREKFADLVGYLKSIGIELEHDDVDMIYQYNTRGCNFN